MSNLINYKGFSIPQPTPANLGGEALANNFKRLGDLLGVTSGTFYVDNTRADVYEPEGSVLHPFLTIQDAINAALALADAPGSDPVSAAIQIGPGTYPELVTVDLPERTLYLSIHGAGSGSGNSTVAGPIDFQLREGASHSSMISIADIGFVTNAGSGSKLANVAFKVTDSEDAGFTTFFLNNVQCWADRTADYAMHVTDGGGSGLLNIQCDGHTLIKSTQTTSSASDAVTGLRLDRGQLVGFGTGFYGLRAPAIIVNGTSILQLTGAYAEVLLSTAGAADIDCVQATGQSNARFFMSFLTPAGNGNVVTHTGTFDGTNGTVAAQNLAAVLNGGSGGMNFPNRAALIAGQITNEIGAALPVTVASPALRLYASQDTNIGFTAATPSDWVSPAPVEISNAINRLAAAVAALQSGPIG